MDRADQDFLNNENNSNHVVHAGPNGNTTIDEHDDDDDGGVVDSPTVEAHIDLAKIACEYYITQSCQNIHQENDASLKALKCPYLLV